MERHSTNYAYGVDDYEVDRKSTSEEYEGELFANFELTMKATLISLISHFVDLLTPKAKRHAQPWRRFIHPPLLFSRTLPVLISFVGGIVRFEASD